MNGINNERTAGEKNSFDYRKEIIRRMKQIKRKAFHIDIFLLVLKYKIKYTQNNNGIFFNITPLHEQIIYAIDSVIRHYESYRML